VDHPELVATLRTWGVRLIFDPKSHPLPVPNQGEPGSVLFPWAALRKELRALQTDLTAATTGQPATASGGREPLPG
jgi:hypothetical protein